MMDYTELIEDLRLFHNRSCERCWEYIGANCPVCMGKLLEDAADAIDELWEKLADAEFLLGERPDDEWISVADRLPDEKTEVEIYCKNGAMFFAQYWRGYDGELHWTTCGPLGSCRRVATNRVTHWKPKPEPPEENGKRP